MNDIDISLFYGKNIYIYIYIIFWHIVIDNNYKIIIHIIDKLNKNSYIILTGDSMGLFSFLEYLNSKCDW